MITVLPKYPKRGKEWLYIGHYTDVNGNFVVKIGTTNNLKRRLNEHNCRYRLTIKNNQLLAKTAFRYDLFIPLSHKNTLKYEKSVKDQWRAQGIGTYIPNDRFVFTAKPQTLRFRIRKEYTITF